MQFSNYNFTKTEQAVLQTLLYSDLFDFPLSKNELWRFLLSEQEIDKASFEQALANLLHITSHREKRGQDNNGSIFERDNSVEQDEENTFSGITISNGLYCLAGRESIIRKRKENFLEVKHKITRAKKAARYLSFIPTVRVIGLSGGLAIGSATKDDDIDFFIITKKNTLFVTRFWILIILEAFGLRRKRDDDEASNKICVNLLLDESRLAWKNDDRNVYVAHEIMQMRLLFERKDTYSKFIESNLWIKNYFPNFSKKQNQQVLITQNNYLLVRLLGFFLTLAPFEYLMRILQKYYMRGHITTEIVTNSFLALHPYDYKSKTMEDLASKSRKLGLLTNI